MSTTCKYCNEPENKHDKPGLICETCICFVHLSCLRRPGTPGDFACDVFFDFTCEDCSSDKKEIFNRKRFPWVNVILLTLHHLSTQSYGISNRGFFHYKTHICSFIDRYWHMLFEPNCKQKKNWVGTIAGVLSVYNNFIFRSGSTVLGETGWWRLQHKFSPAVADHIIQEIARERPKRPRNHVFLESLFMRKVTEMGYKHLINMNADVAPAPVHDAQPAAKKRRPNSISAADLDTDTDADAPDLPTAFCYDPFDPDSSITDDLEGMAPLSRHDSGSAFSEMDSFRGLELMPTGSITQFQSDSSSIHSMQHSIMYYDSDSRSASPHCLPPLDTQSDDNHTKSDAKIKKTEDKIIRRDTLFSKELNSVDLPWSVSVPKADKNIVEMTQYEEIQLLKQVEGLIPKIKDPNKKVYLCRLKAKLALRRLKRHKHLPIFDLDKAVKLLGGYVTEDPRLAINTERVLDRFQRSYLIDNLCGTIASTNYGTMLTSRVEPTTFRSMYSGVTLKPYIRRDYHTRPMWLKLMDELLVKTNRHVKGYTPPPRAPIDYCYVRPQHIAAVNNLCAQFFWPGIDLSESLQYPEYSCVVMYKRVVVGCAFLVPDARARHSEAYISFVLTRPEWRNASIASFMLYHLLQTCTGRDVTLHVSPTNPAIFLYQKFGFKVEELVQDFYEKYYDIDYKGCRHALFLRLTR